VAKITAKLERGHHLQQQQMQLVWVKIGHLLQITHYNSTRSSAMAEGLHDVLVSIEKLAIDE